jgi:hypothetical protein
MSELTYTMPATLEDRYITGSYGDTQFEIPAVFNDDILDTEASILKVEQFKAFIDRQNTPSITVEPVLLEDGSVDIEATKAKAIEKYNEGTV